MIALSAVDFLDNRNDSKSDKDISKKFHKVDLDRDEMISDGKGSKYKPTTMEPIVSTTSEATKVSTTKMPEVTTDAHKDATTSSDAPILTSTSKVKTTSNTVPIDDITTTTEKVKTTTTKSSIKPPSHAANSLTWILGKFHFYSFQFSLQQK